MKTLIKSCYGGSSVLAVFFVSLFSVLAISFTAVSNTNVQVSHNHSQMITAQAAAESGLAYAHGLFTDWTPVKTSRNTVSDTEAAQTWQSFAEHVRDYHGLSLYANPELTLAWTTANNQLYLAPRSIETGSSARFTLEMQLILGDTDNPHRLVISSTGADGNISRRVSIFYLIQKNAKVLEYAIASRGRVWLTGDSTIHGSIFSDWDNKLPNGTPVSPSQSPFNITSDSVVEGTINTVISQEDCIAAAWQLETLDENGNPVFDEYGNRVVSPEDEIQGQHEGVNYGQASDDMPGMSVSDYNTDDYTAGLSTIPAGTTQVVEYFPHAASNYSQPRDAGSTSYTRHVYQNQTISNALLSMNRHALFRNCTFEGVLYIDSHKTNTYKTYTNNVRFENCTFNGVIVTDVPQSFNWKNNCLYFTGSAAFNNQSSVQEATILAPHFNVNLGNTNPIAGETNTLTGAIVGGIVDIRGNADVYGTIISMCDTSAWTSGYVSNIGATDADGGSETTEPGDIGTINITPDPDNMLPSGVLTPIVFIRDGSSYVNF